MLLPIVLPAERAQYAAVIDGILSSSDLATVSAKAIRKGLAEKLGTDLSEKKVKSPLTLYSPSLYRSLSTNSVNSKRSKNS